MMSARVESNHIRFAIIIAAAGMFLLLGSARAGAATGHIQVVCEEGARIFLDGKFMGTAEPGDQGLIIKDVAAGKHVLKAEKEGYQPQLQTIELKSGEVFLFTVNPFTPKIKITESGNEDNAKIQIKTGTVIIQSLPVKIDISIPDLDVDASKTKDIYRIDNVPARKYSAVFGTAEKKIEKTFDVNGRSTTYIFIDFTNGGYKIDIKPKKNFEKSLVQIATKKNMQLAIKKADIEGAAGLETLETGDCVLLKGAIDDDNGIEAYVIIKSGGDPKQAAGAFIKAKINEQDALSGENDSADLLKPGQQLPSDKDMALDMTWAPDGCNLK